MHQFLMSETIFTQKCANRLENLEQGDVMRVFFTNRCYWCRCSLRELGLVVLFKMIVGCYQ